MIVEILYYINLIAIALFGLIWYARAQKYLKGWNESLESQKSKIEQLNKLYEMNIKLLHEKRELEKEINKYIKILREKNKDLVDLRHEVRKLKSELSKVNKNEKDKN